MNIFEDFRRWLTGSPTAESVEDTHVRLLNNWTAEPDCFLVHPNCVWTVASGHPYQGVYEGKHFLDQYAEHIAVMYAEWIDVTHEIIGSQIGGIITGDYHFKHEATGLRYKAPFTHFYRISRGQIVSVRCYMGDPSIELAQSWPDIEMTSLFAFRSCN